MRYYVEMTYPYRVQATMLSDGKAAEKGIHKLHNRRMTAVMVSMNLQKTYYIFKKPNKIKEKMCRQKIKDHADEYPEEYL